MKEYKLQKEDYELIVALLKQHTRSIEHAVDGGDFIIEPTLAEFRDRAIRTRIGIEQTLMGIEEKEEELSNGNHVCGLQGFNPMLGDICPRCVKNCPSDFEILEGIEDD